VALLGRTLGSKRWLALIVLTLGVSVVSLPSSSGKSLSTEIHDFSDHFFPRSVHELGLGDNVIEVARELTKRGLDGLDGLANELTKRSASYQGIEEDQDSSFVMNYSVGVMAVVIAAVVSGLAGVYFEKVLKGSASQVSVWTRNIQLSFYSLFPALIIGVIVNDGEEISKHGFFDGYNSVVWVAIMLQAFGGVLSSICVYYADNIAKNFATSISIILSFVACVFFFDFEVTTPFVFGTLLVIGAAYLYSTPDRMRSRPPPINIVSYEKTTIDHTPRILDENRLNINPMDSARAMGLSSSRPASPLLHLPRTPSSRGKRLDD